MTSEIVSPDIQFQWHQTRKILFFTMLHFLNRELRLVQKFRSWIASLWMCVRVCVCACVRVWVCVCFPIVPLAPVLRLQPINCTSISVRWHPSPGSTVALGYRLYYHEEGQPEDGSHQLSAEELQFTITGLGRCSSPSQAGVGAVHHHRPLYCAPICTSITGLSTRPPSLPPSQASLLRPHLYLHHRPGWGISPPLL